MSWLPLDKSTLIKNLIALPPGSLSPCFLSLIKQANLQWLNVVLAFFSNNLLKQDAKLILSTKSKKSTHPTLHTIYQLYSEQMQSSLIRVHFPSGFTSGREEGQKGQISLKAVFYGAAPSCPYKNQEKCSA